MVNPAGVEITVSKFVPIHETFEVGEKASGFTCWTDDHRVIGLTLDRGQQVVETQDDVQFSLTEQAMRSFFCMLLFYGVGIALADWGRWARAFL